MSFDILLDTESAFTNISIEETVNYIIKDTMNEKLRANFFKIIFKILLVKLTTQTAYKFTFSRLYFIIKQWNQMFKVI